MLPIRLDLVWPETAGVSMLFDGLFDDAALFPPAVAPMAAAVPAHRQLRRSLGGLLGPFVVPASRLGDLAAAADATAAPGGQSSPPLDLSVIAGPHELREAVAHLDRIPCLRLTAVEVPGVTDRRSARQVLAVLADEVPHAVTAAVELPRSSARADVLDELASTGYRAKIRTGGMRADMFPGETELAAAIIACAERAVAFKCTAGLHHAVRHTDPGTGFEHHGFLNVLVAADAASSGGPRQLMADVLAERDANALTAEVLSWDDARMRRVRATFTSFGTCSVLEPVGDLVALGLLPAPERIRP